ncbi:MAG: hypothetical protein JW760_01635 [Spirochaetales bacterium]|nr:hypothetical protein [Spirochaetales bacterium]
MREKVNKYLNILKLELLDMEEDLLFLEEVYRQRGRNKEITNYVLLENVTVIQREIRGLNRIVESMKAIAPDTYTSLQELQEDLKKRFHEQVTRSEAPEGLFDIIKRKMQKVAGYISAS